MWIWPVYRGQNGPNSAASVSWEATFDAPSGLFRQFQGEVRRIYIPRTPVNRGWLVACAGMQYSVSSRKDGANVKKTLLCVSLVLASVSSSVAIIGTWFGPQS